MARVFLDTNIFIDSVKRRPEKEILRSLMGHTLIISPISIAIYCYLYNIKIPNRELSIQLAEFQVVNLSQETSDKALQGPTSDFEDNVQLYSAAEVDCDLFLTNDQKLLKMKYFGKTKIQQAL